MVNGLFGAIPLSDAQCPKCEFDYFYGFFAYEELKKLANAYPVNNSGKRIYKTSDKGIVYDKKRLHKKYNVTRYFLMGFEVQSYVTPYHIDVFRAKCQIVYNIESKKTLSYYEKAITTFLFDMVTRQPYQCKFKDCYVINNCIDIADPCSINRVILVCDKAAAFTCLKNRFAVEFPEFFGKSITNYDSFKSWFISYLSI